jgi:hypothetical protein
MNEIKLLFENPFVLCVVNLETAIWGDTFQSVYHEPSRVKDLARWLTIRVGLHSNQSRELELTDIIVLKEVSGANV